MTEFAKAKLQRVSADTTESPIGAAIEVQFNPTSLKVAVANTLDTGSATGQAQFVGTTRTLSLELVFDSAEEGTTAGAKSVLEKTAPIEQLLEPQSSTDTKSSPAKVRFEWGEFVLAGSVDSLTLDLELFSESGVPLRAKISLSIQEQRADFEGLRSGPGANAPGNAVAPGKAGLGAVGGLGLGLSAGLSLGGGLGVGASVGLGISGGFSAGLGVSVGSSANLRTTSALEGESAAELCARVGVDPSAWRAVAAGQDGSSLALSAGAAVDFSTAISGGAGVGVHVGVGAQAEVSLAQAFGVQAPRAGAANAALTSPGFALAAAGGLQAALDTVQVVESGAAADAARRAFAAGGSATPGATSASAPLRPERPAQPRAPLHASGFPSRTEQGGAPPAPALPRPDRRASSFGLGVPLRPRPTLLSAPSVAPAPRACGCGVSRGCGCARRGTV
jgi:hypothetical protein